MSEKLGPHFTLSEFTRSATAARKGIRNVPTSHDIVRLRYLVTSVLEPLRLALQTPVHIESGYRSPALNLAVGGSETSSHMLGQAADIAVSGYDAARLLEAIRGLGLPVDQVIGYAPERGGHVHVSAFDGGGRRQYLWAPAGGRYVDFDKRGSA